MNNLYIRIKRKIIEVLGDVILFFSRNGYTSFFGRNKVDPKYISSLEPEAVVNQHFKLFSSMDHINRKTMTAAINLLGGKPATILETGSSAWGTNSSLLFDSYVREFGGRFATCDIRFQPTVKLFGKVCERTSLHKSDSVSFLEKYSEINDGKLDLIYLDSFDVNMKNSWPSAIHCLQEFLAIEKMLSKGTIILIDDTPISIDYWPTHQKEDADRFFQQYGMIPGKGMLLVELLKKRNDINVLQHEYQLLIEIKN